MSNLTIVTGKPLTYPTIRLPIDACQQEPGQTNIEGVKLSPLLARCVNVLEILEPQNSLQNSILELPETRFWTQINADDTDQKNK